MSIDSVTAGAMGAMSDGTMAREYGALERLLGGMGHDGPAWVVS